ncbi:hypothetical protein [Gluconobacter sp.]|uniref:hypothetical protein n=1 Tax=Gluconobacter sp. TaxID=1876758 RepID=UPI0039EBEEA8
MTGAGSEDAAPGLAGVYGKDVLNVIGERRREEEETFRSRRIQQGAFCGQGGQKGLHRGSRGQSRDDGLAQCGRYGCEDCDPRMFREGRGIVFRRGGCEGWGAANGGRDYLERAACSGHLAFAVAERAGGQDDGQRGALWGHDPDGRAGVGLQDVHGAAQGAEGVADQGGSGLSQPCFGGNQDDAAAAVGFEDEIDSLIEQGAPAFPAFECGRQHVPQILRGPLGGGVVHELGQQGAHIRQG